jgi:hypothetical protein
MPAHPSVDLRARLKASQAANPDLIDLFGALLDSAAALKAAGETIFHHDRNSRAHGHGGRADATALAEARRAANRAIAALDAFEATQ